MQETTDLFGIPVPSTNRIFLAFVVFHILVALIALVSGVFAMLSDKTNKVHPAAGSVYFWSMVLSFSIVIVLSIMRWPHNLHLLIIGILSFGSVYFGRKLARDKIMHWQRRHTIFMGASFVLLLTGFYVDNGKNLPFWNLFPRWFFYVFPSLVGIPIIVRALKNHPLNKVRT